MRKRRGRYGASSEGFPGRENRIIRENDQWGYCCDAVVPFSTVKLYFLSQY
jgi:hypothetical protein